MVSDIIIKICIDLSKKNHFIKHEEGEDLSTFYQYIADIPGVSKLNFNEDLQVPGYKFPKRRLNQVISEVRAFRLKYELIRSEKLMKSIFPEVNNIVFIVKNYTHKTCVLRCEKWTNFLVRQLISRGILTVGYSPKFFKRLEMTGVSFSTTGLHDVKTELVRLGIGWRVKDYREVAGETGEISELDELTGRLKLPGDKIPENGVRIFLDYSTKNHLISREPGFKYFGKMKGFEDLYRKSNLKIKIPGFLVPKSKLDYYVNELEMASYTFQKIPRENYSELYYSK
jgi:hypothetical protein